MKFVYKKHTMFPIVHYDGTLEVRPFSWELETLTFIDCKRIDALTFNYIFVHEDAEIEFIEDQAAIIKTKNIDIRFFPREIIRWNNLNLRAVIESCLSRVFMLRHSIRNISFDGAIALPCQAHTPSDICIGFGVDIIHGEDYDPRCMVCSESTETIHTIFDEWLSDAILVEQDWAEQDYFKIKNTRQIIILKKSDKPKVARLLEWFVENFEETIKLAAIDKIVFRDYGTTISYEYIIKYEQPTNLF